MPAARRSSGRQGSTATASCACIDLRREHANCTETSRCLSPVCVSCSAAFLACVWVPAVATGSRRARSCLRWRKWRDSSRTLRSSRRLTERHADSLFRRPRAQPVRSTSGRRAAPPSVHYEPRRAVGTCVGWQHRSDGVGRSAVPEASLCFGRKVLRLWIALCLSLSGRRGAAEVEQRGVEGLAHTRHSVLPAGERIASHRHPHQHGSASSACTHP